MLLATVSGIPPRHAFFLNRRSDFRKEAFMMIHPMRTQKFTFTGQEATMRFTIAFFMTLGLFVSTSEATTPTFDVAKYARQNCNEVTGCPKVPDMCTTRPASKELEELTCPWGKFFVKRIPGPKGDHGPAGKDGSSLKITSFERNGRKCTRFEVPGTKQEPVETCSEIDSGLTEAQINDALTAIGLTGTTMRDILEMRTTFDGRIKAVDDKAQAAFDKADEAKITAAQARLEAQRAAQAAEDARKLAEATAKELAELPVKVQQYVDLKIAQLPAGGEGKPGAPGQGADVGVFFSGAVSTIYAVEMVGIFTSKLDGSAFTPFLDVRAGVAYLPGKELNAYGNVGWLTAAASVGMLYDRYELAGFVRSAGSVMLWRTVAVEMGGRFDYHFGDDRKWVVGGAVSYSPPNLIAHMAGTWNVAAVFGKIF